MRVRPTNLCSAALLACLTFAVASACSSFDDDSVGESDGGGVSAEGGNGGDGGDGSVGADGGGIGEAGSPSCPVGKGAPMVRIADFCIDERETTFGDYNTFLIGAPSIAASGMPAECAFKTGFEPANGMRPPSQFSIPAHDVDWCDAWAYCAWAGKRLCGGHDGASLPYATLNGAEDEWYRACSNGRTTQFPYGATYDVTRCNVGGHLDSGTAPGASGSFPGCRGTSAPFDAITDLVGNIGEWQRSCNDAADAGGAATPCRVRGGGWYNVQQDGCLDSDALTRSSRMSKAGIRCCADPLSP
jgi:formylglycine-generating enzyme